MYESGKGVTQDFPEAVKWYRLAAGQWLPKAQNNLGHIYQRGQGAADDYAQYQLPVDQALPVAQNNPGYRYGQGQGVAQDYTLAYMWINLAAEQGDANAGQALDTLARRMMPLQLAKAQKMAQACQARKYKGCE